MVSMDDHDQRHTRLEVMLEQQQALLAAVRGIVEQLSMQQTDIQHRLTRHDARLVHMQQTLDAIKDLLDRGNGH
jgi:hypothetical protein